MAEVRELASGLKFPEGPVAMSDGSVVLVEIQGARISRVSPDGSTDVVAETGGGPNGSAIGPDGKLYVANNGGAFEWHEIEGLTIPGATPDTWEGGRIERVDLDSGEVDVLYRECDGNQLRGPNDLVYVCRHDAPRGELVVVTLWEEGEDARVPRRFTDALRPTDERPKR